MPRACSTMSRMRSLFPAGWQQWRGAEDEPRRQLHLKRTTASGLVAKIHTPGRRSRCSDVASLLVRSVHRQTYHTDCMISKPTDRSDSTTAARGCLHAARRIKMPQQGSIKPGTGGERRVKNRSCHETGLTDMRSGQFQRRTTGIKELIETIS